MDNYRIIYITDPLCGWCYAVAPLVEHLSQQQEIPPVTLLHRALFTGQMTRWMSRSFSDYVMDTDRRITELSGQTFSQAYRDNLFYRNYLIFDSWPTAKAIQVIRNYDEAKVLPFFQGMQQARFIEGKIITDTSVLCEIAASVGLQADLFHNKYMYDERTETGARQEQQQALQLMARVHANGVPTFLLQQGKQVIPIPHEQYLNSPETFIRQLKLQLAAL